MITRFYKTISNFQKLLRILSSTPTQFNLYPEAS